MQSNDNFLTSMAQPYAGPFSWHGAGLSVQTSVITGNITKSQELQNKSHNHTSTPRTRLLPRPQFVTVTLTSSLLTAPVSFALKGKYPVAV